MTPSLLQNLSYTTYLSLREGPEQPPGAGALTKGRKVLVWHLLSLASNDSRSVLAVKGSAFAVENSPESHKPVEISDLRPCVPCVAQGIPRVQPAAQRPLTGR